MATPYHFEQDLWGFLEAPIFLVCQNSWQIQWCNSKATSLFGIEKGSMFSTLFPGADLPKLIKRLQEGRHAEFSVETKDRLFLRVTFRLKQLSSGSVLFEGHNDMRVLEAEAMSASYVKLVEQQKRQILKEKELNEIAHRSLHYASELITQSINYASRIQKALLPSPDILSSLLGQVATWWEPRDVVGGDLYWAGTLKNRPDVCSLALFDCTGHGVPGAFMTALVVPIIDTLNERGLLETPNLALAELDRLVRKRLGQDNPAAATNDGLDIGICVLNRQKRVIEFAGAGIDLFRINCDRETARIKGQKHSIGYRDSGGWVDWVSHSIFYEEGDVFLMFSDGFVTQPGGPKVTALGHNRLLEELRSVKGVMPSALLDELQKLFRDWHGVQARRDDITLIIFAP